MPLMAALRNHNHHGHESGIGKMKHHHKLGKHAHGHHGHGHNGPKNGPCHPDQAHEHDPEAQHDKHRQDKHQGEDHHKKCHHHGNPHPRGHDHHRGLGHHYGHGHPHGLGHLFGFPHMHRGGHLGPFGLFHGGHGGHFGGHRGRRGGHFDNRHGHLRHHGRRHSQDHPANNVDPEVLREQFLDIVDDNMLQYGCYLSCLEDQPQNCCGQMEENTNEGEMTIEEVPSDVGTYSLNIPLVQNVKPGNVKISLRDNVVTVEGKTEETTADGDAKLYQEFTKKITLPEGVKKGELKAVLMPDGVLKVEAPLENAERTPAAGPTEVPIQID